jgi:hypothetical protein
MDLIGEEMSWNGNFYDDERVEDIIWDWITERSED